MLGICEAPPDFHEWGVPESADRPNSVKCILGERGGSRPAGCRKGGCGGRCMSHVCMLLGLVYANVSEDCGGKGRLPASKEWTWRGWRA